jgi:hypothetical protein
VAQTNGTGNEAALVQGLVAGQECVIEWGDLFEQDHRLMKRRVKPARACYSSIFCTRPTCPSTSRTLIPCG